MVVDPAVSGWGPPAAALVPDAGTVVGDPPAVAVGDALFDAALGGAASEVGAATEAGMDAAGETAVVLETDEELDPAVPEAVPPAGAAGADAGATCVPAVAV